VDTYNTTTYKKHYILTAYRSPVSELITITPLGSEYHFSWQQHSTDGA